MATLTADQYNEQLAELLSEGTGTTIGVGALTPTAGSKKLSWGEIKKRMIEGLPINEGEFLPDIPEGITSQQFYQHGGFSPATTMFSMNPFSEFETSIAGQNLSNQIAALDVEEQAEAITSLPAKQTGQTGSGATTDADEWDLKYGTGQLMPTAYAGDFGDLLSFGITKGFGLDPEKVFESLEGYDSQGMSALDRKGKLSDTQWDLWSKGILHSKIDNRPFIDIEGEVTGLKELEELRRRHPDRVEENEFYGQHRAVDFNTGKIVDNNDYMTLLNERNSKFPYNIMGWADRFGKNLYEWAGYGNPETPGVHKKGTAKGKYDKKTQMWYDDGFVLDRTGNPSGNDWQDSMLNASGLNGIVALEGQERQQGKLFGVDPLINSKVAQTLAWYNENVRHGEDKNTGRDLTPSQKDALLRDYAYKNNALGVAYGVDVTTGNLRGVPLQHHHQVGKLTADFNRWRTEEDLDILARGKRRTGVEVASLPVGRDYSVKPIQKKVKVVGDYDPSWQDPYTDMTGTPADPGTSGVAAGDVLTTAWASGGEIDMQEGGMAPPMLDMPQEEGMAPFSLGEGTEQDASNLGIINEPAEIPQEGGQKSVQDDISREADEGDYILPYETVLMVGLKVLNRNAREAIDLAMKNGIDLGGTDLDPTDDVPIKVSNYEFHIPKVLVPFFGGGKKYLDKIRDEGLALRKRLEEEQQPSAEQQQPQPTTEPAPPQLEAAAPPPQMAPPGPPQAAPPMMQKGGFVLNPNEQQQQQTPTTAAVLESDTSQPTQESAAYNQLQALQRAKKTQQQPPMVDPTGKVIPQGFAAPQGYQEGSMVEDPELAQASEPKTEPPMPDWANRALDPKTPVLMDEETGEPQTLATVTDEINGMFHVYPTIRMVGKELKRYDPDEALSISMKKKDSVKFKTLSEADTWAQNLTDQIGKLRNLQQPPQSELIEPLPVAPPEEQGFAVPPPAQPMAAA